MRRYGVFSVTGDLVPLSGGTNQRQATAWYVYDSAFCGEIVFESFSEHAARNEALRLNADERRWEKQQERSVLVASNGRAT